MNKISGTLNLGTPRYVLYPSGNSNDLVGLLCTTLFLLMGKNRKAGAAGRTHKNHREQSAAISVISQSFVLYAVNSHHQRGNGKKERKRDALVVPSGSDDLADRFLELVHESEFLKVVVRRGRRRRRRARFRFRQVRYPFFPVSVVVGSLHFA